MGDISAHFDESEFYCPCTRCTVGYEHATVSLELVHILEIVRARFGEPIHISSGVRCPPHNLSVRGKRKSKHLKGIAADFSMNGIPPLIVAAWLDGTYPDTFGIGFYHGFTHLDVRVKKARFGPHLI